MGLIVRTAQRSGAKVIGVIRSPIKEKAYKQADEMHIVPNAYEMNLGIIARSDVVVALVGGIGTLNELTEVIRMNKNGQHAKPVIFVNTDNFYNGFQQQMQRMGDEGFLSDDVMKSVHFADTPEEAIHHLESRGR